MMLRCVSTTPFGSPELPLVNSTLASARSPRFGSPSRRAHHWFGSTHAASSHGTSARRPPHASSSAFRSTVRGGQGKLGSFARTASAVITVAMPPILRLCSSAARPAVKLRFTGTLPAAMIARLAMNGPTPGGSTTPTRASGTVARRRRDSTAAAAKSCPHFNSRRPTARSTTSRRHGCFVSVRTHSRPRWRLSAGRSSNDWRPRSRSSRRAHVVLTAVGGVSWPNEIKTFVGISRGDFQRYLLPAKENTEPHSPSIAAAITGTFACRAINSKPGRMAISCPVREMCPSGQRHTSSPAFSARTAARRPSSGCFDEIGIAPLTRKHHAKNGCRRRPQCPT